MCSSDLYPLRVAPVGVLAQVDIHRGLEGVHAGLVEAARAAGIPCVVQRVGAMITAFFTREAAVHSYHDAKLSDVKLFGRFFRAMLARGVYLAPSQFEAAFLSTAHTDEDIDRTCRAAAEALLEVR